MKKLGLISTVFGILLITVLIVGEIKCIVKLVRCDFEPSYKAEVIYGISAITGIGAITGYMDFGK